MKKILFFTLVLTLGILGLQAQSITPSKWQMRVRGVAVMPNESAEISSLGGGDISINSKFIPELDFTYFFTKHIAAELILGTSKHDVHTVGSNLNAFDGPSSVNIDLGSVWLLPPTLIAQYHFLPDRTIRPYIGAGLNYSIFYSVDPGNSVTSVTYDNAFGFASQVGLDVKLTDKFFFNIDAKYIMLKTDVNVNESSPSKVDINPFLLGFGVGMKF